MEYFYIIYSIINSINIQTIFSIHGRGDKLKIVCAPRIVAALTARSTRAVVYPGSGRAPACLGAGGLMQSSAYCIE